MTDIDRRGFLIRTSGSAAAFALVPGLSAPINAPRDGLRVAVVGAGRQGRAILGELAKLDAVAVGAVCDIDESRLSGGLRRVQGAAGYGTLTELLDKEADVTAVIVATPTHLHRAVVEEALAAGKHVFCESPLASSIEDAKAMVSAARSSEAVFHVGLQGRTNPVYKLARSFVKSGALRDRLALRAQWHQKTSWRFGASSAEREKRLNWRIDPEVTLGLPGEVAGQQLDTLAWFLGKYPQSVRGRGAIRHHQDGREIADTVQLEFGFPDELHLQYEASLGSSYEGSYELMRGSNSTVKLASTHAWMFKEADAPTQGWEVYANRQRFHNDEGITLIADATKLASQGKLKEGVGLPHPPLYYALESFVKSVVENKPAVVGPEAGFRAAVIGMQAAKAVRTGLEIVLPEELYVAD